MIMKMKKKLIYIFLIIFICACTKRDNSETSNLMYYSFVNEEVKQQIRNYVDSVSIQCDEKMLIINIYDQGYDSDDDGIFYRVIQFDISYSTTAFDVIFGPYFFAKIDTIVAAITWNGMHDNLYFPLEIGWEYLKDIFKSDYQYYLEAIKIDSDFEVDEKFDDKRYKVPLWTFIFKDDRLVTKIIDFNTIINYETK